MDRTPSPKELSRQMQPHADQLRAVIDSWTEDPWGPDTSAPAALQLASLAAEIAVLTAYVLNTTGDPLGTGRHNLQALRDLGTRLAQLAEQALRDEPKE